MGDYYQNQEQGGYYTSNQYGYDQRADYQQSYQYQQEDESDRCVTSRG